MVRNVVQTVLGGMMAVGAALYVAALATETAISVTDVIKVGLLIGLAVLLISQAE
jgi:hypothetical protein